MNENETTPPAEKRDTPTCVDCGTQNCKIKTSVYPGFCLTTRLPVV